MGHHLAIYGSPRGNGFSAATHDIFLSHIKRDYGEIKIINIYKAVIGPCSACGFCETAAGCSIEDEMSSFYNLVKTCSSITISTPLYFSSLPGPLKNFIDRCQTLWQERQRGVDFSLKKGALIISAGSLSPRNPEHAVAVVRHFLNTINCSLRGENIIVIDDTDNISEIGSEKKQQIRETARFFRKSGREKT